MNLHLQLRDEQQKAELIALAAQFNQELENRNAPFPKAATLHALKEQLIKVLFEQEIGELWYESQTKRKFLCLNHDEIGIRNLPWKLATAERPRLAIAKSPKTELEAHSPSIGFPLKVLVMVASPEGTSRLDYEKEELLLLRAFSPLISQGLAQVHFTDDGSLENLREKLNENRFHILHFTGHGSYHEGEGVLAMEDSITGQKKLVNALEFNDVIADVAGKSHCPELLVLSACQTAQGSEVGDLTGVADTLLAGNVPAVIAMSASILDNCASIFAAKLYEQLSNNFPLPDAFQDACVAIREFEKSYKLAEAGLAPGQWLIPQLLLNKKVLELINKTLPSEKLDFKDVEYVTGDKALVNLRVRPKNYVFVGRRKEKRIALKQLKNGKSILLRGQGGVGKTALAEHLAIRLLAQNPKFKVFTFSEKTPAGQSLLDQMQNYLTKEKKYFKIVSELALIPKQTDKFFHLLGAVSKHCDPVFLFDNIESFQKFDVEKSAWVWHQEKHEDIFQLMQILDQQTSFPLIITGRYPIAEFPELEICNMNTVPFGDFFRKCHQLGISELAQKMRSGAITYSPKNMGNDKPPTFEDVVKLLHKTFGGNYRALEFFDELYAQKGEEIFGTLKELSAIEEKLSDEEVRKGVHLEMAKDLIFKDLLGYLNEQDKDTLFVLAQFNIPVLPMAIGMQRNNEDRTDSLKKAVNLTLVERQTGTDSRERFYVMPLVRDLLGEASSNFEFEEKVAGDYHKSVENEYISENPIVEYTEAFKKYYKARSIEELNQIGEKLCNFYGKVQLFKLALFYGNKTEQVAKADTRIGIWNVMAFSHKLFGNLNSSMTYLNKILKVCEENSDYEMQSSIFNNLGQLYEAKGEFKKALDFLHKSIELKKTSKNDVDLAPTFNNLGKLYISLGEYPKAEKYLLQALSICEKLENSIGLANTLNNLGNLNFEKGNYSAAHSFLDQSLLICREIGDQILLGTTLNNLSQIFVIQGQDEQALKLLEESIEIQKELGGIHGLMTIYSNIGRMYTRKQEYHTALKYFDQSLKISEETEDTYGNATARFCIGEVFMLTGDYEKAIKLFIDSISLYRKVGSPHEEVPLNCLYHLQEMIGPELFYKITSEFSEKINHE